jgi:hypothetical protein
MIVVGQRVRAVEDFDAINLNTEAFLGETFLGTPCMSGDDKRYTCLIL